MGADQEPGRRVPVDAERRRRSRNGPGPARPVEAPHADHADDRSFAAVRPGLREDFAALPRASGPVRGRVRPGLVQADASRHGSDRALSRPARAEGDADLAGPGSRRRSSAGRASRTSPRSRRRSSPPGLSRSELVSTAWASASTFRGSDKRGGGERRAHPPRAAEGLGGQRPGQAGEGACSARSDPEGVQRLAGRRQEGLARRPDRARRRRGDREGGEGRRPRREGSLHAGTHGRVAGRRPTSKSFAPLEPVADGFRNYLTAPAQHVAGGGCWWTGRIS